MNHIEKELARLQDMPTSELAEYYEELHKQPCRTRHKAYLIRKIAWRIQANAEGGLSERARRRAMELANDADIRVMAPKTMVCPPQQGETGSVSRAAPPKGDPRLPAPGSALVRQYKGRTHRIVVLPDGNSFDYHGERYNTLTAVAKQITGTYTTKHGTVARMNTGNINNNRHRGPDSPNPIRQPRPALAQTHLNLPHDPTYGARAIVSAMGVDYAHQLIDSLTSYLNEKKEGAA